MCGICGIIGNTKNNIATTLHRMNDLIRHRGPDDEGYTIGTNRESTHLIGDDSNPVFKNEFTHIDSFYNPRANWAIAHRRFSIIATNEQGHQPWSDPVTGNTLVFNGEIYNYIELKNELVASGHGPFKTTSDTEVLGVAYRAWGTKVFNRLNGFWAIAIYDSSTNRIILSRDRIGKKPLYYSLSSGTLYFSSEIRSLVSGLGKPWSQLQPHSSASYNYLLHDRRNSFQSCLWDGIEMLQAAHYAVIDPEHPKIEAIPFWSYPNERLSEKDISFNEAAKEVRDLFQDAIRIRLRTDVPYAADLSGGIDSSTIVAAAQKELGKTPLRTNYIGYPSANELDESNFARDVANFVGSDHREIEVNSQDTWDQLDYLTEILEEPVHSLAFFTQWLGWKRHHANGLKVILHGAAGDELMCGYQYLWQISNLHDLNNFNFGNYFKNRGYSYRSIARIGKLLLKGELYPNLTNPIRTLINLPDRRRTMPGFTPQSTGKYFNRDFLEENKSTQDHMDEYFIQSNADAGIRMLNDFKHLRIPFWVNAMDKSMMSIPIEVRMPFLDYRLVERMLTLPVSYHYSQGWSKHVFRHANKGRLPQNVLWRKDKLGFSVPQKTWINQLKPEIQKTINNSRNRISQYIECDQLLTDLDNIPEKLLWRIFNFSKWISIYS